MDKEDIYSQFLLDAPRMNIWVDGSKLDDMDPVTLFFQVFEKCRSWEILKRCTQGWLAFWYEKGIQELGLSRRQYLVDGGSQDVLITTSPLRLVTTKPFKIVEFDKNSDPTYVPACLTLIYLAGKTRHVWNKGPETEWAILA